MLYQLFIGALITIISLMGGSVMSWLLNEALTKIEPWLRQSPHHFKSLIVVFMAAIATMCMIGFGVWLWALVFERMAVFSTWEEAVYYSLVAYTTLGLGDVVVPEARRLLGGMTGANGFLMFGFMTALLTDTLRYVRRTQRGEQR